MTGPRLTLGINNCFAVKRWTRPEQWAGIVRDDLGLSSVQYSLDLLPTSFTPDAAQEHLAEVTQTATAAGIEIRSTFTGLAAYGSNLLLSDAEYERDAAERWYEQIIGLTSGLGAQGFGGHVGAFSVPSYRDGARRQQLWTDLIGRMRRLAEHAKSAGLEYLLFENLAVVREPGYSIPEAKQLQVELAGSAVPWRLCLDLGHPAALQTGTPSDNPVDWAKQKWPVAPVIQLQQSPRGADHHGAFTLANNADGLVHRDEILQALREWDVPEIELYLEIIPPHEADDDAVLRDLVETVEYWRTGIANMTD